MSGRYEQYWLSKLDDVAGLLKEAYLHGESSELDVSDIQSCGRRQSYRGNAEVFSRGFIHKSGWGWHVRMLAKAMVDGDLMDGCGHTRFQVKCSSGMKLTVNRLNGQADSAHVPSAVPTPSLKPRPRVPAESPTGPPTVRRVEVSSVSELPSVPAVYAMYSGQGSTPYVSYVGVAGNLRARMRQHLVVRRSNVTSEAAAIRVNPDFVLEVRWWEHPDFSETHVREAAELVAAEVLDPTRRMRSSAEERAARMSADAASRDGMMAMFLGEPAGRLVLPTLRDALEKIAVLERRVAALEQQPSTTALNAPTALSVSSALEDAISRKFTGGYYRMRPVFDALRPELDALGGDVPCRVQKRYISFRRGRAPIFAVVKIRQAFIRLHLRLPDGVTHARLFSLPSTAKATWKKLSVVKLFSVDDIDEQVLGWLADAYERSAT